MAAGGKGCLSSRVGDDAGAAVDLLADDAQVRVSPGRSALRPRACQQKRPSALQRISNDGAKRIRTADPLHAMQVLYQLSYGPVWEVVP